MCLLCFVSDQMIQNVQKDRCSPAYPWGSTVLDLLVVPLIKRQGSEETYHLPFCLTSVWLVQLDSVICEVLKKLSKPNSTNALQLSWAISLVHCWSDEQYCQRAPFERETLCQRCWFFCGLYLSTSSQLHSWLLCRYCWPVVDISPWGETMEAGVFEYHKEEDSVDIESFQGRCAFSELLNILS